MVIALSGKKGSGKDSFYQISVDYFRRRGFSGPIFKFAFADRVKKYAEQYFGVDLSNDQKKEETRFILKGIGQMIREEVNKDYWANIVFDELYGLKLLHGKYNFIAFITDVRYFNEAQRCLREADFLIRVVNPRAIYDPHQSEVDLDNFPFGHYVWNDGGLGVYKERVGSWLKEHVLI